MHCIIAPLNGCGGIYLGNVDAALDEELLDRYQIHAVLTVMDQSVNVRRSKLWIMADDEDDFPLHRYFDHAIKFIESKSTTNILIHCYAGISRSATLLAAYLMKKYKWSHQHAISHIQARRPIANPNPGFCKQLEDFGNKAFMAQIPQARTSSFHSTEKQFFGSKRFSVTRESVKENRLSDFTKQLENFRHKMKLKARVS